MADQGRRPRRHRRVRRHGLGPNAPSIADLHAEYVEKGGRFFACPVCVKVRGMEDATWTKNAEVKGAPSLYEFTAGGALTFNY